MVIVLIFIAAFAVIAPVLIYSTGAAKATANKQVIAALDTALGPEKKGPAPIIDFRKNEDLSSIPWLNSILLKVDVIPRLQKILNQAEVKWSPGTLILLSLACVGVCAVLVQL